MSEEWQMLHATMTVHCAYRTSKMWSQTENLKKWQVDIECLFELHGPDKAKQTRSANKKSAKTKRRKWVG